MFSHGILRVTRWFQGATLSSYSMGSPKPSVWTPSWRRASKAINRRCALNVMIWAKTPPNVKVSAGSHRASTNVSSQPERFRMSLKIRCSSASVFSSLCSSACGERCNWEDFQLVADGIGQWDMSKPGPRYYTLETFEPVLRSRLERLQEALSKDRFETTLNNAVKIHNDSVDEYAATLRQSGI